MTGVPASVSSVLVLTSRSARKPEYLLAHTNEVLERLVAERTASLQMANEDLRHNEKIIRHLVLTDPLTEVANRRCLNERLDQEINRLRRYRRPLSLILCDIDFFKKVNDTYGHDIGDLVLKVFATTVKSALRREDLLGRYGGEEFVVILPETVIKQAGEVAERIRTRVEAPCPRPGAQRCDGKLWRGRGARGR